MAKRKGVVVLFNQHFLKEEEAAPGPAEPATKRSRGAVPPVLRRTDPSTADQLLQPDNETTVPSFLSDCDDARRCTSELWEKTLACSFRMTHRPFPDNGNDDPNDLNTVWFKQNLVAIHHLVAFVEKAQSPLIVHRPSREEGSRDEFNEYLTMRRIFACLFAMAIIENVDDPRHIRADAHTEFSRGLTNVMCLIAGTPAQFAARLAPEFAKMVQEDQQAGNDWLNVTKPRIMAAFGIMMISVLGGESRPGFLPRMSFRSVCRAYRAMSRIESACIMDTAKESQMKDWTEQVAQHLDPLLRGLQTDHQRASTAAALVSFVSSGTYEQFPPAVRALNGPECLIKGVFTPEIMKATGIDGSDGGKHDNIIGRYAWISAGFRLLNEAVQGMVVDVLLRRTNAIVAPFFIRQMECAVEHNDAEFEHMKHILLGDD